MLALAGVAFALGALIGASGSGSRSVAAARRFVSAWTRGDYASMYGEIDASARRHTQASAFAATYSAALRTATATSMSVAGRARSLAGARVAVPVRVHTRVFGTLALSFTMRVSEEEGGERIVWSRSLEFPGLRPGERVGRDIVLPPRATVLARDGSVLAEGQASGEGTRSSRSARSRARCSATSVRRASRSALRSKRKACRPKGWWG